MDMALIDHHRRRVYRKAEMDNERSTWDPLWRDLSDHILPNASRFTVADRNRGNRSTSKIIDSTATFAVDVLSSGMMSGITSPARPWFALRTEDPDLNESRNVKVWLDFVRSRMDEVFRRSNLYTTLPQVYSDLGVYGTTAFALLPDKFDTIRCYHFPVGSYSLGTDYRGVIDTCAREFQMSVLQLVQQFGYENCSESVKGHYNSGRYDFYVDVVHFVEPNVDHDLKKLESKFKRFRSIYYEASCQGDGRYLQDTGFDTCPVLAPRWRVTGEDIYGTSPGMVALGDIKALQLEQKRKGQALDKLVNPPMVGPSSLRNQRASILPGDITYVDSMTGQQGFTPAYAINPHFSELLQDIQDNQGRIKKAFYEDLFLMLANDDRSNITATEISARKEEKLLMLGPVYERLNDELLDPLIDRTFAIMLEAGEIPPPPPEIQGMDLSVEYVSVMAQSMKLLGIQGIERLVQFAGSLAGGDPNSPILRKIDMEETLDQYAQMVGVPPSIIRDREQVAAINAQEQQSQQMAQMPQVAAAAKDGAQAAQALANTQVTDPSALSQMVQMMRGGV